MSSALPIVMSLAPQCSLSDSSGSKSKVGILKSGPCSARGLHWGLPVDRSLRGQRCYLEGPGRRQAHCSAVLSDGFGFSPTCNPLPDTSLSQGGAVWEK